MNSNELTGIEIQLVLQYLVDGNVPLTVTPVQNKTDSEKDDFTKKKKSPAFSAVFPVALQAKDITVLKQGIILLENPKDSVKAFSGKNVKVQFYFNKLGLYFETQMKQTSSGSLALVIPHSIKKIQEEEINTEGDFSAVIYLQQDSAKEKSQVKCSFLENYPLFQIPKWKDVQEKYQLKTKDCLQKIITQIRSKEGGDGLIGNGVYLITLSRFLSGEKSQKKSSNMQKIFPPSILYIDTHRIVFGEEIAELSPEIKNNFFKTIFQEETEYGLLLSFPIFSGPIKERIVYLNFKIDSIFYDEEKTKAVSVGRFTSIQEEDSRFLEDKFPSQK